MDAIAHGGCTDTVRESALKLDSGRKIPCRIRESNLRRQCAGPMHCKLSYIPRLGWHFMPSQPQKIKSGLKKQTSACLLIILHTRHQTTNSLKPIFKNLSWHKWIQNVSALSWASFSCENKDTWFTRYRKAVCSSRRDKDNAFDSALIEMLSSALFI